MKNWYFWTVVFDKILEGPLDSNEIQLVNLKEISPEYSLDDAEAEAPMLWPPDVKNWLIGKGPDVGKDGGQEEKGPTEDERVGWPYWLDGHEFE